VSTDRSRYTSLMSSHLKEATRDQLQRRNYVYSDARPDLRVNFFVRVDQRHSVRSVPTAGPGFRGYSLRGNTVDVSEYRQGTLVVEVVDARRNALVWQGVAEGVVDDDAMKNPGLTVDSVIRQIFETYPTARRS